MSRERGNALRLSIASFALCLCFGATIQAQTPSPSPSQDPTKAPDKKPSSQEPENPFAPEPAGPLPAGPTGLDANDPRSKLTPGVFDAGEAALGMKHVQLVKKPDVFQLGSNDPDSPKVKQTLGLLGIPDTTKIPK